MRAPHQRRKRTAQCPKCNGYYSPQGLAGHLMFKHNEEGTMVGKQVAEASLSSGGSRERADATVGLINRLKEIQSEIENLPAVQDGWFSEPNEAMADCLAALKERELEIRNDIRKLAGKRPLRRTERPVWWGGTEEALVEDEGETLDA